MKTQWADFTDSELVDTCFDYGIEEECEIDFANKSLKNRTHVETVLTLFEFDLTYAGA